MHIARTSRFLFPVHAAEIIPDRVPVYYRTRCGRVVGFDHRVSERPISCRTCLSRIAADAQKE